MGAGRNSEMKQASNKGTPKDWFRRAMREIVEVLGILFRRIGPRKWLPHMRALANSEGWMPPMLMIAGGGVILTLNVGVGLLANVQLARTFNLLCWCEWILIGGGASTILVARSHRNMVRFGAWGICRPRWWFELARSLWIVFLFVLALVPLGAPFLWKGQPPAIINTIGGLSLLLTCHAFVLFLSVATVGYGLSFLKGMPRRGHAYQCVRYFYAIVGGICLITYAGLKWPPAVVWLGGVALVTVGIMGAVMLFAGFVSAIRDSEKRSPRDRE